MLIKKNVYHIGNLYIKEEKVVIVTQNGSISTPIYHQRGLHFHRMNYYAILKEHLQVLNKLQP